MRSAAKELARQVLPDSIVARVQRATRERNERDFADAPYDIDLSRVELIRGASVDQLRDRSWLEHELLPHLGFNTDHFEQFPQALSDHRGGLYHWQYPSQFAPYLSLLSGLELSSYVEIGTRHGGTFVITCEYLERFGPLRWAVGADLYEVPALERYAAGHEGFETFAGNSQAPAFRKLLGRRSPDLALVDGDHSEQGCWLDTELMLEQEAKVIVLHDIVNGLAPGVGACWRRLRREQAHRFDFHEFTSQYEDATTRMGHQLLGIGVAVRKDVRRRS